MFFKTYWNIMIYKCLKRFRRLVLYPIELQAQGQQFIVVLDDKQEKRDSNSLVIIALFRVFFGNFFDIFLTIAISMFSPKFQLAYHRIRRTESVILGSHLPTLSRTCHSRSPLASTNGVRPHGRRVLSDRPWIGPRRTPLRKSICA